MHARHVIQITFMNDNGTTGIVYNRANFSGQNASSSGYNRQT